MEDDDYSDDGGSASSAASSNTSQFHDRGVMVGESSTIGRKTATKHYNEFALQNGSIPLEEITTEHEAEATGWLGKFSDYLLRLKLGTDTRLNYLSHIKTILTNRDIGITPHRYATARSNLQKSGQAKRRRQGETMSSKNFVLLCREQFKLGTVQGARDRAMFAFDWATIGRISEVAKLRYENIAVCNYSMKKCLRVSKCVCVLSAIVVW